MKNKLFLKKLAVVAMAFSLVLGNASMAEAQNKSWEVYHAKGAPSSEGVFTSSKSMDAGSNTIVVYMNNYSFSDSNATITTYRKKNTSKKEYLTTRNNSRSFSVLKDEKEVMIVHMATSSADTVRASGIFSR